MLSIVFIRTLRAHSVLKPCFERVFFFSTQCLGNHEFENGPEGLAPFLKSKNISSVPVVTTNIDTRDEPSLTNIRRSAVLTVGGHTVGVVGYLTPDTEVRINRTRRRGVARILRTGSCISRYGFTGRKPRVFRTKIYADHCAFSNIKNAHNFLSACVTHDVLRS